ncbi:DSC-2 [Biomphalaria pfeifferi]|uniref:DSC-2 n=1 Tax=Biomphalaria pfeifferi TaxID=112525 RepID=A0AAD8F478_BIOPF|nr:DSC-2 [Biomphalaria pfeifferi]
MTDFSLLFVLSLSVAVPHGNGELATLKFEAQPGTIHPVLTKELELRCSVHNSNWKFEKSTTTTSFLQYFTTKQPLWNDTEKSNDTSNVQSSNSQDQAEFSRLLSLVVTKVDKESGENETIASVTGCDTPVIENRFVNTLQVVGSTEGSPVFGEQGYLTLTWDSPVEKDAGYFICEAYALNSNKHPVSLSAALQISALQPQISDLVSYISTNDKYILDMKAKVTEVYEENQKLREQARELAFQNDYILNRLDRLRGQNSQSGRFQCSYSTYIDFNPPFNSTPKVILSLASFSFSYSYSYSMSLQSVSNTSFSVYCSNPSGSTQVDWFATD